MKKNSIKNFVLDLVSNGIYDVIKFVFGLLITTFVSGGLAKLILGIFTKRIILTIIIIILMIILSITCYVLIYKKKYKKYKYRLKSIDINFEYLGSKIIVTSKIRAQALKSGLHRIYNRYTWFDDEKSNIRCISPGYTITRLPRKDTSYEYYVDFHRILKKGEVVTYIVRVTCYNYKKHFKNFYTREIITPTDYLSICINISSKYNVKKLICSVIKGSAYNSFVEKEEIPFLISYKWVIPEPRLGWEYKVSW